MGTNNNVLYNIHNLPKLRFAGNQDGVRYKLCSAVAGHFSDAPGTQQVSNLE